MIVLVDGLVMMTAMLIVIRSAGRSVAVPTSSSQLYDRVEALSQPVATSRTEAHQTLDSMGLEVDEYSMPTTHTGQEPFVVPDQMITSRADNEEWLVDQWIEQVMQPDEDQENPTTNVDYAAPVTPVRCGILSLEERLRSLVSGLEPQSRMEELPPVTAEQGRLPRRPNKDLPSPKDVMFRSQQNRVKRHLQHLQQPISRAYTIGDALVELGISDIVLPMPDMDSFELERPFTLAGETNDASSSADKMQDFQEFPGDHSPNFGIDASGASGEKVDVGGWNSGEDMPAFEHPSLDSNLIPKRPRSLGYCLELQRNIRRRKGGHVAPTRLSWNRNEDEALLKE